MAHIKVASVVGNEINLPLDGEISAENATNVSIQHFWMEKIGFFIFLIARLNDRLQVDDPFLNKLRMKQI